MDAPVGLVQGLVPTTAHLAVRVPGGHPSAAILGTERMGSAVVVDPGGLLLTVNYVVMGARRLRVTLPDGRRLAAEITAQDFESGLALVGVGGRRLPAAGFGDSDRLQRGSPVFALAAVGPRDRRVAGGVLTDLGQFDAYWEYLLERSLIATLQNPGFGGGPLFDMTGRLVGIVSLNLGDVARQSLAIPVTCFTRYREELLRHGRVLSRPRRAWVGVFPQPVGERLVVAGLVPRGPGERGGLREGDVIVSVNQEPVDDRPALYAVLWRHQPGDRMRFEVERDDRLENVEVIGADRAEFYAQGREVGPDDGPEATR